MTDCSNFDDGSKKKKNISNFSKKQFGNINVNFYIDNNKTDSIDNEISEQAKHLFENININFFFGKSKKSERKKYCNEGESKMYHDKSLIDGIKPSIKVKNTVVIDVLDEKIENENFSDEKNLEKSLVCNDYLKNTIPMDCSFATDEINNDDIKFKEKRIDEVSIQEPEFDNKYTEENKIVFTNEKTEGIETVNKNIGFYLVKKEIGIIEQNILHEKTENENFIDGSLLSKENEKVISEKIENKNINYDVVSKENENVIIENIENVDNDSIFVENENMKFEQIENKNIDDNLILQEKICDRNEIADDETTLYKNNLNVETNKIEKQEYLNQNEKLNQNKENNIDQTKDKNDKTIIDNIIINKNTEDTFKNPEIESKKKIEIVKNYTLMVIKDEPSIEKKYSCIFQNYKFDENDTQLTKNVINCVLYVITLNNLINFDCKNVKLIDHYKERQSPNIFKENPLQHLDLIPLIQLAITEQAQFYYDYGMYDLTWNNRFDIFFKEKKCINDDFNTKKNLKKIYLCLDLKKILTFNILHNIELQSTRLILKNNYNNFHTFKKLKIFIDCCYIIKKLLVHKIRNYTPNIKNIIKLMEMYDLFFKKYYHINSSYILVSTKRQFLDLELAESSIDILSIFLHFMHPNNPFNFSFFNEYSKGKWFYFKDKATVEYYDFCENFKKRNKTRSIDQYNKYSECLEFYTPINSAELRFALNQFKKKSHKNFRR
ncbi:hypothetical protein GVAV_001795 [Gurleya vavrai]